MGARAFFESVTEAGRDAARRQSIIAAMELRAKNEQQGRHRHAIVVIAVSPHEA